MSEKDRNAGKGNPFKKGFPFPRPPISSKDF